MRALDGIRVLDFGRYIAGPFCATIMADFGADVIRVERRGGGEDRWVAPVTESGEGSVFLNTGRNKRSLTLDSRHPDAAEIQRRLIETADVVVVNVPDAALKGMGLDYETLKGIKSDIILANVSSFGPVGPWKDRGGFDSVGQVMCGSAHLTGEGHPFKTPITWVDHSTALYATIGVMMALRARDNGAGGQQISGSLLGSAMAFSTTYLIEAALTGIDRQPIGNRSPINGPTDIFKTKDGWIVTQVVSDPLFRRWARLMEEPEWIDDPRFANDGARGDNGAILSDRMSKWVSERTTDEALDQLGAAGIPGGPVLTPAQALEHPQVQGMGLLREMDYPGLKQPTPTILPPVNLSETPAEIRRRPPTVGEHNAEILESLGFSADDIAAYKDKAVI